MKMSCLWSVLLFAACATLGIEGDLAGLVAVQVAKPLYRTAPPVEPKYQSVQYHPSHYRVLEVAPNEHQTIGVINLFPSSDVAFQTYDYSTWVNQTIHNMTTEYMTTVNTTVEFSTIITSATPIPVQATFVDPVEYQHETLIWYKGNISSPILRTEIVENDLPFV